MVMVSISSRLKKLRLNRGLSLSELAARVGTSSATLFRYESDWDRFELYTLEKIASALGYKLDLNFTPIKSARLPKSAAGCIKKIQRLFWDHELKAGNLKKYPQWIVERVIEYGNLDDIYSLMGVMGKRMFLKQVSNCRFQSRKTFFFWKMILEKEPATKALAGKEGVKCTKKSFQREVKSF